MKKNKKPIDAATSIGLKVSYLTRAHLLLYLKIGGYTNGWY